MEKKSSTVLDKALKEAMDHYKITVQRYWIVTLVGPDVRRLMENLEGILERVAKAILASGGDTEQVRKECKDFVERHMAVCRPLRVTLRLMWRVERLDAADQVRLKEVCAAFDKAWRTC
jgi:UDP-N-acetylmuramoylalanine-D-glutamate ligase